MEETKLKEKISRLSQIGPHYNRGCPIFEIKDDMIVITDGSDRYLGFTKEITIIHPITNVSYKVSAMFDTGTTVTCVTYRMINLLNLTPTGNKVKQQGIEGVKKVDEFTATLVLDDIVKMFYNLTVHPFTDPNGHIDILIGLDIISEGELNIKKNEAGELVLKFDIPELKKPPTGG